MAPGTVLREWIIAKGILVPLLSVSYGSPARKDESAELIMEVLDGGLLADRHARVLGSVTLIPADFWLALEQNYRACLAVTEDPDV